MRQRQLFLQSSEKGDAENKKQKRDEVVADAKEHIVKYIIR